MRKVVSIRPDTYALLVRLKDGMPPKDNKKPPTFDDVIHAISGEPQAVRRNTHSDAPFAEIFKVNLYTKKIPVRRMF